MDGEEQQQALNGRCPRCELCGCVVAVDEAESSEAQVRRCGMFSFFVQGERDMSFLRLFAGAGKIF